MTASMISSSSLPRRLKSTPRIWNSPSRCPAPTPRMTRPRDSASSVQNAFAVTRGCRTARRTRTTGDGSDWSRQRGIRASPPVVPDVDMAATRSRGSTRGRTRDVGEAGLVAGAGDAQDLLGAGVPSQGAANMVLCAAPELHPDVSRPVAAPAPSSSPRARRLPHAGGRVHGVLVEARDHVLAEGRHRLERDSCGWVEASTPKISWSQPIRRKLDAACALVGIADDPVAGRDPFVSCAGLGSGITCGHGGTPAGRGKVSVPEDEARVVAVPIVSATSRARFLSSRQTSAGHARHVVVHVPADGSAWRIASCRSRSAARSPSASRRLKQSAPRPRRAASRTSTGCRTRPRGRVRRCRLRQHVAGGIEKCLPRSCTASRATCVGSRAATRDMSRVVSPSGCRSPELGRRRAAAVPNSKRPSERWSSIATRSAVAPVVEGGVGSRSRSRRGCAACAPPRRAEDLGRRDVRVLLQEVVLDRPHVLEAGTVARLRQLELAMRRVCSAPSVGLHLVARDVRLHEHPNSITPPRRRVHAVGAPVLGDEVKFQRLVAEVHLGDVCGIGRHTGGEGRRSRSGGRCAAADPAIEEIVNPGRYRDRCTSPGDFGGLAAADALCQSEAVAAAYRDVPGLAVGHQRVARYAFNNSSVPTAANGEVVATSYPP